MRKGRVLRHRNRYSRITFNRCLKFNKENGVTYSHVIKILWNKKNSLIAILLWNKKNSQEERLKGNLLIIYYLLGIRGLCYHERLFYLSATAAFLTFQSVFTFT